MDNGKKKPNKLHKILLPLRQIARIQLSTRMCPEACRKTTAAT